MIATCSLPDYLPARMLNEFVYCPRLFYYEWVEGLFAHNSYTVEGALRHSKLDAREDELPAAGEIPPDERIHARSVTLASQAHRLIARLDLVEAEGNLATPVDYKRGSPRKESDGSIGAWDPDRVQICAQALVLRDNGYDCREGVIYYVSTKQRIRLEIDDALVDSTLGFLARAWQAAENEHIPPPLVDSPKCPKCSLVGICLPDETRAALERDALLREEGPSADAADDVLPHATADEAQEAHEVRRLVPARDDLRPLYLNTQGLYVGKSGNVLRIKEKDKVVEEVRINDVSQINVFGNIQITTQTVQTLCENDVPMAWYSMGGWFYGVTQGLGVKNVYLRREQFRWAESAAFRLDLSRALVAGKVKNQRTLLQRNHVEPPARALALMKCLQEDASRAESEETLLGIEGNAARIYFENFAGMIKVEPPDAALEAVAAGPGPFTFDFQHRNRRPPKDPVNALLSLAYSVLSKDLTIVCHAVGFDPFLGFYHHPRFGRPALALDLMEPFRPLIADSAVLTVINTRMVSPDDFVRTADAVALRPEGRKAFFRAYEQRMDALVTHPLFGYRVNYRRILEVQTRLLARVLTRELDTYHVFTTR
jgi:CRISPR-associated protein Cas1